jgi:hypothetical protein
MTPEFVPGKQLILVRQLAHSSLKVFYHLTKPVSTNTSLFMRCKKYGFMCSLNSCEEYSSKKRYIATGLVRHTSSNDLKVTLEQ